MRLQINSGLAGEWQKRHWSVSCCLGTQQRPAYQGPPPPRFVPSTLLQGKKRAQKDRAYLTATEWREEGGGFKKKSGGRITGRLPFDRCAISFQPFEDPVRALMGDWLVLPYCACSVRWRLPSACCCAGTGFNSWLTLPVAIAFIMQVCTADGTVFDIINAVSLCKRPTADQTQAAAAARPHRCRAAPPAASPTPHAPMPRSTLRIRPEPAFPPCPSGGRHRCHIFRNSKSTR